jgi:hypothetical protein
MWQNEISKYFQTKERNNQILIQICPSCGNPKYNLEINKENVFLPTRHRTHQKEYINAMVSMLIIQHGAVEFTTLENSNDTENEG